MTDRPSALDPHAAPPPDVPAADVLAADVLAADVLAADVLAADVPAADVLAADVLAADVIEHDAAHAGDELPLPLDAQDVGDARHYRRHKLARRYVKWAVAAIVLLFVGRALYRQIAEASTHEVAFRWPFALLAVVSLTGLYGSLMASERSLLKAFAGVRVPLRTMMAVAWVPLAGKYVPGKVAAVAGAVVLLRRVGVATATGLSIFVLLDAMPILTGSVLSGLLAFNDDLRQLVNRTVPLAWVVLAAAVVGGVVCVQPPVFRRLVNFALKLLRRPPLPHVPKLRDYAAPAAWSLGQWAGNSGAIFLMCVAFAPPGQSPGLRELPDVVGITALVMCVSYFSAFVTPSGLGVREGLMLPLLSTLLPPPAAAAVTVAMRLAHTLVELCLCGVGLLMLRTLDLPRPPERDAADPPAAGEVVVVAGDVS